jgi:hypothetical protein
MAGRRIRDLNDLLRLSDAERNERKLALRAVREARDEALPLEVTAKPLGLDVKAVRRWAPDAVRPTRSGRTFATDSDSVVRFVPVVVEGEVELVAAEGLEQAASIRQAFDAQYGYLNGWSPATALRPYEGMPLPDGRIVTTDPELLKRVAIEDPTKFLEIYGGSL